jgi:hypothetical protein
MWVLTIESLIVGIITFIIGMMIFNLTINKNNKDIHKPYGINIAFFLTGVIIYIVLEITGLSKFEV